MNIINYLGQQIPLDDADTWRFLAAGENLKGIFQLETDSASYVLKSIKPKNIEDLSIANAVNRPGPMKLLDKIAEVRDGKEKAVYDLPQLEPILKDTASFCIYQEQVLKIAQTLAGYAPKDSAHLLKVLGKKKIDEMEKHRQLFTDGMKKNGFTEQQAKDLFARIEDFANYGFNKSHSVSYSLLGYISAYIKYHQPLKFFTSLLNYSEFEQSPLDEIFDAVSEMSFFGIKMLPPSIDRRNPKFCVEDGGIRYSMRFMRSMGDAMFAKVASWQECNFLSLDAFLESAITNGPNSRAVEALIVSGALDRFGAREEILLYYHFLIELTDKVIAHFWEFKNTRPLSYELLEKFVNYDGLVAMEDEGSQLALKIASKSKKGFFSTERGRLKAVELLKTLRQRAETWKEHVGLCRFVWENHVLGFSFANKFHESLTSFAEIAKKPGGNYTSCGFVEDIRFRSSKKGNEYALLDLRYDKKDSFIAFGDCVESLRGVQKGSFLQLKIRKQEDKVHIETARNLDNEIVKYKFWIK